LRGSRIDNPSGRNPHRHRLEPMDTVRVDTLRVARHLDHGEALQDFFPQDAKLQFRHAVAHTAMDSKPERRMLAWPLAIDDHPVRFCYSLGIAVAGAVGDAQGRLVLEA
jgi:hypothetical protein